MKAILICPDRPAVALLAENAPLAIAPLLGKSVLESWLEALAGRGVRHVVVLASDRPHQIRHVVGDGARWGLQLDLIPLHREPTIEEARRRYASDLSLPSSSLSFSPLSAPVTHFSPAREKENEQRESVEVILLDHLPGFSHLPLFASYAGWFAAVAAFLPHAITPARVGAHEIEPGIWVGLHAQVAPSARLTAPCWIGDRTVVGDRAAIGPNAMLDDRVVVERGAAIAHSVIGPETFIGEFLSVQNSLVHGATVVNWQSGSCLHVPDAFLACSLGERSCAATSSGLFARTLALAAMLVTAPFAFVIMLLSFVRGENPLLLRLGVRPIRHVRSLPMDTFAYYELAAGRNWLRRWPQFWSVVRGDFAWVGNRPLRPTQVLTLTNNFERLWLTAPVGLVSLADAYGCVDGLSEETSAHAAYYAVNASRRLAAFVLLRTFFLALAAWPIRWTRRKERSVSLPQLVPKQEI